MSVMAAAGAPACSNTISALAAAGVDQVRWASPPGVDCGLACLEARLLSGCAYPPD